MRRAYRYYRPGVIERGVAMTLKAAGLKPNGWLHRVLSTLACRFLAHRQRKMVAA
ncbi:hypothetical protein D3C83_209890 [compost metagenome]